MKICTKCKDGKKDSAFYYHKRDGHNRWCKSCCQQWKQENVIKMRAYRKKYYDKNKTKKNAYQRKRWLEPVFRLNKNISRAIRRSLKNKKRNRIWEGLLGFSLAQLVSHLESQFTSGMSWDNYGQWHIDHIRPIASFNYDSPEHSDFELCWSLSNLQPLWAKDNLSKSAKLVSF